MMGKAGMYYRISSVPCLAALSPAKPGATLGLLRANTLGRYFRWRRNETQGDGSAFAATPDYPRKAANLS